MSETSTRKGGVVKIIFKVIAYVLIFGTIGILLWRIFSSGDPQSMKTLYVDDKLHAAWQQAQEEDRDIVMYTQEYDNITRAKHNYGYFSITQTLFIKDTDEVQLTFRYNNSTIRHLKEDYGLAEIPNREEDLFDVTLVVIYDLTPADKTDNENQDPDVAVDSVKRVRYTPVVQYADTKNLYNYRKLVFEDVGLNNTDMPILGVFVDVYYKGDIDYEEDSYGTLSIFNYNYPIKEYQLTGKDKDALADYQK